MKDPVVPLSYLEFQHAHRQLDGTVRLERVRAEIDEGDLNIDRVAELVRCVLLGSGFHHATVAELLDHE